MTSLVIYTLESLWYPFGNILTNEEPFESLSRSEEIPLKKAG